ncbi:hypothetical protein LCGC14_1167540 [marine sediment metagenome]|uniref:Uncharacterized protein n=1 Tax=marine sediment metagenome TaxID=412755 RepID=A0A0F9LVQ8_9ZZZZ
MDIYQLVRKVGFARNLVGFHKKIFGSQDYCFDGGEYRLWVWEKTIGNRGWRVYVGNQKGICFEVDERCSYNEAMSMADDYLSNVEEKE